MRLLVAILCWCGLAFGQTHYQQFILADTDAPATPTDSPGGGTYGSTQSVTLADATATAIFYTIDGTTTPTCLGTGTLYTGAISVSATTTIKAIGCNGITGGGVLTSVYTISGGSSWSSSADATGTGGATSGGGHATTGTMNCASANTYFVSVTSASASSGATVTYNDGSSHSITNHLTDRVFTGAMPPYTNLFYVQNVTGSGSVTFDAVKGGTDFVSIVAMCNHTGATSGVYDSAVDQFSPSCYGCTLTTNGLVGGSGATPSVANEMYVASFSMASVASTLASTGYTCILEEFVSGQHYGSGLCYKVKTDQMAETPSVTSGASGGAAELGGFEP